MAYTISHGKGDDAEHVQRDTAKKALERGLALLEQGKLNIRIRDPHGTWWDLPEFERINTGVTVGDA